MFIAMNRFQVNPERVQEFEQISLEREAYLQGTPGFVEFHMLRSPERVDHVLYASHTVWRSREDFEAWTHESSRGGCARASCAPGEKRHGRQGPANLLKIASGEMTRETQEFQEMLRRDCLDVYQPDAVCSIGMLGLCRLAQKVAAHGKWFTPHTWGNGIGLMANLHLAAGSVGPEGCPYLEFPFDPPEWTPEVRDYPLANPLIPYCAGWLTLSEASGLGIILDEKRLRDTRADKATYS